MTAAFNTFVNSRGSTSYQLVLANRGPARADDVTFDLTNPTDGLAPDIMMQGHTFPITLDPGQAYTMFAVVVMGTAAAVDLVLRWRDGTGSREKTMTLSVFG